MIGFFGCHGMLLSVFLQVYHILCGELPEMSVLLSFCFLLEDEKQHQLMHGKTRTLKSNRRGFSVNNWPVVICRDNPLKVMSKSTEAFF